MRCQVGAHLLPFILNAASGEHNSPKLIVFREVARLVLPLSDPMHQPPELEFTLFDLMLGLLKRKRAIAVSVFLAGLAAIVASFLVPSSYTATTKLMPPQQTQSITNQILGQLGPLAGLAGGKDLSGRNPSELYVAILRSDSIEDTLIQQFNLLDVYHKKLMEDARKVLGARSEIVASKEGIISISVKDKDPGRAAAIANGYVDDLYKLNQTLAVSEAAQRRLFFEQQLDQEKDRLANAEVALAQAEQKSGLIQLDSQARATIEQNSQLEAELAATEVQLRSMSSFATTENPDYVSLKERETALQAQIERNASKQGPGKHLIGTGTIPELGVEYLRRMRDLKYHDALYELLMRQTEAAKIDEAKNASIIQVLDKALIPQRRSSPRRIAYLAGGLLLGAFFSSIWAVTAEFSDKARRSVDIGPKMDELREFLWWKPRTKERKHVATQ